MRPYRAIPIDGKDFVYGWYVYRNCVPNDTHYIAERAGKYTQVIPETVGQSTGLKDKNGTEVYEGDKLRRYGGAIVTVVWMDDGGCFNTGYGEIYEVIGNIHQERDNG